MTRRIAAAVKIHFDGGSPLLKSFPMEIGAENDKWDGTFNAAASPEIAILGRPRILSWRNVHHFTPGSGMWTRIDGNMLPLCFPKRLGGDLVGRESRFDKFFPNLLAT
jgi:hypothetical protein